MGLTSASIFVLESTASLNGKTGPGFEGKGDRYIKKLLEQFPSLEVVGRFDGPVPNVESIKVRVKQTGR